MKKDRKSVDARQQGILKLVQESGEIRSEDIAKQFGISLMTVRRDLDYLEQKGHLRRTHGGAATLEEYYNSRKINSEVNVCRDRISSYSASFVDDGDTLFINGSRTALNLLKYVENKNVKVITNNGWAIGEEYPQGISVRITGGDLRSRIMVGELTMQSILETQADKTFIGCAAVYENGEFVYDIPMEIGINEVMITKTRQNLYILADHTKLHMRSEWHSAYGSCTYARPYTLVTDDQADPEIIEQLRLSGADIVIVPTD